MLKFSYLPVSKNVYSRRGNDIKYIVIHDTGNTGRGAGARAHRNYVGSNTRGASAHYFVDDKEICQFVGDSRAAGAVGDGRGRYGITNQNSLSIEICINRDGNYEKAVYNARQLTQNLMKKFNVPLSRVVRHYDASRKCCPCSMSKNNWARWKQFKRELELPMELIIDTSKNYSEAVPVGKVNINTPTTKPKEDNLDNHYKTANGLTYVEWKPEGLYVQLLGGKTLRQVGADGLNGPFFNMANPAAPESCWAIAINGGKPIGPNAYCNDTKNRYKRGTFIYGEGRMTVERINNINEVKRKVDFAIGGVGLYPSYDPKLEKVPADVLRHTRHSGIAFKGDKVYIIASEPCTLTEFKNKIVKTIQPDGAIAVDGGGSTQLLYKGKGIHSNRKLNAIIGLKKY